MKISVQGHQCWGPSSAEPTFLILFFLLVGKDIRLETYCTAATCGQRITGQIPWETVDRGRQWIVGDGGSWETVGVCAIPTNSIFFFTLYVMPSLVF